MNTAVEHTEFAGEIRYYNGNPNLKATGVAQKFTKEQFSEYIKCAQDVLYFIENYCKIINVDNGLVPFKMYEPFKEYINTIHNNRWTILMASRQLGKTTTSAAYILWATLFNKNYKAAILANRADTARDILSRYQLMYENLPFWMQHGIKTWNKGDVELENGSKVVTGATSRMGIRGGSVNLLYLDEMALVPNNLADDFFASVYPTVSSGKTTKIVITSTPFGFNHFWRFWDGAKRGTNGFKPVFIPWYKIPGRDQKWRDEQFKILGPVRFQAEVECEFQGSNFTLLPLSSLQKLQVYDPIMKLDGGVDVLHEVESGHNYTLVVDPSQGTSNDYSAFSVIDITSAPYRVVAKFRDNEILPTVLPNVVFKTAMYYNQAYVLVEINKAEEVASILLNELEYENVVMVARSPKRGQVPFGDGRMYYGVNTDKIVKRKGCMELKGLVENDRLIIEDTDMIRELSTFVEKKNSYAAEEGSHDDLVMTLVLFSWLSQTAWFAELTSGSESLRKETYAKQLRAIEENLTPFGMIIRGTEDQSPAPSMVTETEVWYDADNPNQFYRLFEK